MSMRLTLATLLVAISLTGCEETCLGSDGNCTMPTPCAALSFECTGGTATVHTIANGDPLPGGLDVLASRDDVVLENGVVTVVIDAIDHPHYIAPTGGHIIDMTSASGDDDSLTHVFHAVGLLPGDSVAYESLEVSSGDDFAAVQVYGKLAGSPDVRVATRYEIRPCEPGVRVRTEIVNRGGETRVWTLVDAWYWSGREALPFAPGAGRGFDQPGLVSPVTDSWDPFPFMVAASHADPAASYLEVACNQDQLSGFHTEQVSAVGLPPRVVPRRDYEVFERFIGVAPGRSVGPAADIALEVRGQLQEEPYTELSGTIAIEGGGALGDEARASVVIIEGEADTPAEERVPWTQITPDATGAFRARVPTGRTYQLEVHAFGLPVETVEAAVRADPVDVGTITIPGHAELQISVLVDRMPDYAQVLVHPADEATEDAVRARLFGGYVDCAPLLGSPTGGSPACDRVIVNGTESVVVPPGSYDVYATAGLFATIDFQRVDVVAGDVVPVDLELERLAGVQPVGTLGSDFHVHGAASFDSTIPDIDRVEAWLASNIEVLAATDHDTVWDYDDARQALDVVSRIRVMIGLESTGQILFDLTPGADIPQVIGHWIVWPLPFDPYGPYRGAPWDELAEPGTLFTRFAQAGWPDTGVIQLNHPWTHAQFGRDLGFPKAVGVDTRVPLPVDDGATGPGLILRTPPPDLDGTPSMFSNIDYHTQEVMNGTENFDFLPYRAYWFYLLNQGIVRAGTANSDSHTLFDSILGTPRNLVWTDQTVAVFDEATFNRDVRDGRMIGTNGPVIEISTTDTSGNVVTPSVQSFEPASGAELSIRVSAVPWVPIEEIRIIVNGQVARTLSAELSHPADELGVDGIVRFEGTIALSELLPPDTRDAYIVVEAGTPLPLGGDLDCDGVPDTGDNNDDGVVDYTDVDRNGDDVVDAEDLVGIDPPAACDEEQDVGPLGHPDLPTFGEPGYHFVAVTPGGYPAAFTNPLLFDRDGDGFAGPGLPEAP